MFYGQIPEYKQICVCASRRCSFKLMGSCYRICSASCHIHEVRTRFRLQSSKPSLSFIHSQCNLFSQNNTCFQVQKTEIFLGSARHFHPICPEAYRGFHGFRIPPHPTTSCSGTATSSSTGVSNRLRLRSGRQSQSSAVGTSQNVSKL